MVEIIELPPRCFVCKEFHYTHKADQLYKCEINGYETNDIYEMWEECPYLHKKYLIKESNDEKVLE